jgi:hypothetical protein
LNQETGKTEKQCGYRCQCTCEDNGSSTGPFDTKAHSNSFSSERWDYGSGVCIRQSGKPPTSPAPEFTFETGMVQPSAYQEQYGVKPYPHPISSTSPELCDNADKKCDDCQQ